jgi:predicted ATPase
LADFDDLVGEEAVRFAMHRGGGFFARRVDEAEHLSAVFVEPVLQQLEARLSERFQVLTGGSALKQPRQQTMRTAIDWSYDLLDEDERRVFRRLGVFSNGFSLDAALHVADGCGVDEARALDVLSRLVDKSPVVSDGAGDERRFRVLETIRRYAAEKTDEAGEAAAVRRRHAEYFAALAGAADCGFDTASSHQRMEPRARTGARQSSRSSGSRKASRRTSRGAPP